MTNQIRNPNDETLLRRLSLRGESFVREFDIRHSSLIRNSEFVIRISKVKSYSGPQRRQELVKL